MELVAAQAPGTQAGSKFSPPLRPIDTRKKDISEPLIERLCRSCLKDPKIACGLEQKLFTPGHLIWICKFPDQGEKMNVLLFGPGQGLIPIKALLDQLCGLGQNMQKIGAAQLKKLVCKCGQLDKKLKKPGEVLAYRVGSIGLFSDLSALFGQKDCDFWTKNSSGRTLGLFDRRIESIQLSKVIRQNRKVDSNVLRPFALGLSATDTEVRLGALNGLAWLLYRKEIPFAVSLLSAALGSDPAEEIRLFAAKILNYAASRMKRDDLQRAVSPLAKATFDNSESVAAEARAALVSMRKQGYDMEPAKSVIEAELELRQR